MIAKDYHSLWLNSAALALAGGDLEVAGGVVERDERASRPASCARRPPGASRNGIWAFPTTSISTRCGWASSWPRRAA